MKLPLNKISVVIKYNTVYTCSLCGCKEVGETVRDEYTGSSTADLKEYIDGQRQTSHHMPVGWGYDGKFYCRCKTGIPY